MIATRSIQALFCWRSRAAAALVCCAAAACARPPSQEPAHPSVAAHTSEPGHWEYQGNAGPEHWAELSETYRACAAGRKQSPIAIPTSTSPGPLEHLTLDYVAAPAKMVDNGHTIQVDVEGGQNKITLSGKTYTLRQFHFHRHSEHTLGDQPKAMEVHFVHQAADGALAVLGVLFEEGAPSEPFAALFQSMAHATAVPTALPYSVDVPKLQPAEKAGWSYEGSLTTPPCSEGVRWVVYSSVQRASRDQLAALGHPGNFRPTQQTFAREIHSGL